MIGYKQDTGTLNRVRFDDFDFSVNNLRINPATSKPDYDYNEGEFLFDPAATETVTGNKITKHKFKMPCALWYPHIHWMQSASGNVLWQLEYKIIPFGEIEPVSYTTIQTVQQEFTYVSGTIHQISEFTPIDMTGFNSYAMHVKVKVSRIGGNAADTYTPEARFIGFDFHVPIDSIGTYDEFTGK